MSKYKYTPHVPQVTAIIMIQDRPFGKVAVSMVHLPANAEMDPEIALEVQKHSSALGIARLIMHQLAKLPSAQEVQEEAAARS